MVLCAIALLVAGCSASTPKVGLKSPKGIYAANGATAGPEYFSAATYGVAASPRVATGKRLPRGGGRDQIGKPYTVRGKTYRPTATPKEQEIGKASWYGAAFHGRLTANGEVYDMDHLTAAHKTMPLPSYARVTNMDNGRSVIVRVNDRGPFADDRIIDLSKRAAEILDYTSRGTARVKVEYAGRAPLHGRDDAFLLASIRGGDGGPASDRFGDPASDVLVAMSGPSPNLRPAPPQPLHPLGANALTTGGPVMANATNKNAFVAPANIPVPDNRPSVSLAGVAISAYADMRVARSFRFLEPVTASTGWKTR
ncbi:septal ring lytic transglycosylase RlpA family protein [Oricola cellulosilytica]|uniref:Endolytic peptidoglycan transglycosylase RlpA n=1 Tax=Oricola cellulosilytica TaxID=1429082 RepID=A0A4R0PB05_9HYPH|nr:septal ring lytic transglycosylase RlpA family protein [Oricola cellulosilytica]